ncbi:hypothetical protein DFQ28_003275 [Apophysomyces sp. BC1034]|nr:hypothetical protein DFQ28_003275 [Apophysomyces sp. BC1034]
MLANDLPPWEAVYQQTQRWIRAGCFEAMVHDLRELLRVCDGAQGATERDDSGQLHLAVDAGIGSTRGQPRCIVATRCMRVIRRRSNRQYPADRLDSVQRSMIVDKRNHDFVRRSSSACAKYVDALRRISLTCRSIEMLALQPLDPFLFLRRRPCPQTLIPLRLPHPASAASQVYNPSWGQSRQALTTGIRIDADGQTPSAPHARGLPANTSAPYSLQNFRFSSFPSLHSLKRWSLRKTRGDSNLTISSYGEGLETGRIHRVPRQVLTRQMLFNVLKNGCRVEALQLGAIERLERALALFFDADEICGAYLLTHVKQPAKPKLNEVLRLIARLGGFLGRKGDAEPGAKAIWLGLKELHVAAKTLKALRAGAHADSCV